MVAELKLGDVLRLAKKHPCGSDLWQVVRLGADIGLRCVGCRHQILLERRSLERRLKTILPPQSQTTPDSNPPHP